ncbi:MAG TPA: hypothetical protein DCG49_03905 [Ruminococcus sp.]|nr:hypothetical protein [Ruminococcus sp.]
MQRKAQKKKEKEPILPGYLFSHPDRRKTALFLPFLFYTIYIQYKNLFSAFYLFFWTHIRSKAPQSTRISFCFTQFQPLYEFYLRLLDKAAVSVV